MHRKGKHEVILKAVIRRKLENDRSLAKQNHRQT